jgi:acetyl esterase/lipase
VRLIRDALRRPGRHRYGPLPQQVCDLYSPREHRSTVILIHGGSWQARYGKWVMRLVAGDLVRRGFAVWNVEYRRLGQGGGWPQTGEDVAAAIDRLAEITGEADLVGHSAGGQLALWAAGRRDSKVAIRRVVSLAGIVDFSSPGETVRAFMGGTPKQVPDHYAEADPVGRLPLGIPTLLVHGPGDETVGVARSRRYYEAARAAGDPVELVEPEAGHRAFVDPRTEAWRLAAEWLERGA